MTRARPNSGFTILELLVVIAIFSLIAVMLANGQRFAVRAWETQERQIQGQGDVGAIQNAIRQLLVSGRSFQGDDEVLHWTGPLPHALNRAGLFDVDLKLDDKTLLVAWRPHFNGPMPKADPETTPLAKDVVSFKLAYFIRKDQGPADWSDSLPKDKKPSLIRVTVRLAQGRWPPLVIAPMLEPETTAAPAAAGAGVPGAPPQGPAAPGSAPAGSAPAQGGQDAN